MQDLVMTIEECAHALKVSIDDVVAIINTGELKAKKIGNNIRIPVSSLNDFLNHAEGTPFIDSTFSYWADQWLRIYKKPFVTENTFVGTYYLYVDKHLKPFFGTKDLKNIKATDILEYFSTKVNYSNSTLSKMVLCLNGIFDTAIENDLCSKNPVASILSPRSQQIPHPKRVYTDSQISFVQKLVLSEMPGIVFCLETGLRPGEYVGCQWKDIYDDLLHVQRSIATSKESGYIIRPPKWNSYRTIPLTPLARQSLSLMKNNDIYIYPMKSKKNTPYTPRAWCKILERFFDKVLEPYPDIPRLTPHELRHTFGTKLRRHGADIYTIQKLLGHKSVEITAKIYVHNEIEILRQVLLNEHSV